MRRALVCIVAALAVLAIPGVAAADPDAIVQRTIDTQDQIFSVDLGGGGATLLGNSGLQPATEGFTFCPDGALYGIGNQQNGPDSLVTIDPTTGAGAVMGPLVGQGLEYLACDPDGSLWGVNGTTLFSVDRATGAATQVGATGVTVANGLAADCAGRLYLATGATEDPNFLYVIADPTASSTAVQVGPLGTNSFTGIAFDATATTLWALRTDNPDPAESFTIDTTTGAATQVIADLGFVGASGLAIAPLVCREPPEPAAPVRLEPTFTG